MADYIQDTAIEREARKLQKLQRSKGIGRTLHMNTPGEYLMFEDFTTGYTLTLESALRRREVSALPPNCGSADARLVTALSRISAESGVCIKRASIVI
jgi:hypothetical protein